MKINSTQISLGFSSTPEKLAGLFKSGKAKEEGIRLYCKVTPKRDLDYNPERRVCLFLTTDPKGSIPKDNVKSGDMKSMFAYASTAKEAFDKIAANWDGILNFNKKIKID